ncbi:bifunctional serine/threonine-protein kinase/ABC transporter substrate-binding protein [Actinomadura hibisca]|uniref:bifunctional serine/threonine-protein kinase/ABC transporter substrate-binding protein n=1 Tax=Actinomadura hibisca TaxID=68565 RepID=UPI00082DA4D9|nr:bifunctional serine/threonine-protein kinase/ABC transporter substrate-binding protein [Actinomadura hibisca]
MAEPLLPDDPTRVGSYELLGRLGDGGQGSVYLGQSPGGQQVAVKLLHARLSRDPQARSRFVRELEVAERVSGFCTAQVLDADIDGDRPYIVSEFVDGPSLTDLVRERGPMDAGALLRLAIGTATALAAIHRAGIVHRDFKPPNVLIGRDGARVIDFGIARALDSAALTATSQVVGTPAYMAPEQIAGGAIGPAADVFAWGGTMLFAATGRVPFGGDSIPAVLHAVLNAEADVRALPGPLAALVGSCLAKDSARRPTSAQVVTRLLGLVGAQDVETALAPGATLVLSASDKGLFPSQLTQPSVQPQRRRVRAAVLAVGAVAAVIVVPVVLLNSGGGKGTAGAKGATKTVKVAFMGPLTGDTAHLGVPMRDGARAAVQAHNDKNPAVRAQLVEFDTRGNADVAQMAARRAVDSGVVAVVGPSLSAETNAAVPVLEQAGIPSVSPAASNPTLVERGWKTWHAVVPDAKVAAAALGDLAAKQGKGKKALLVEDEQVYSQTVANQVFARLGLAGVVPKRISVRTEDTDFGAAVAEMKKSGADSVVYGGNYPEAARLVKQARAAGVTARFFLSDAALDKVYIERAGRQAAEGTVFTCSCLLAGQRAPDSAVPGYAKFTDAFAKVSRERPPAYAADGYDAAGVLMATLADRKDTAKAINNALREVNYTGGVTPRVRFTDKGEIIDGAVYAYRARDGELDLLGEAGKVTNP